MAPTAPAGLLVVAATIDGRSVWYSIQPSERDRTVVKTARFSELHSLHKSLKVEVPSFPGRFPSKSFSFQSRQTSAAFVEKRRSDIEAYLRLAATHHSARASKAWLEFMTGIARSAEADEKASPPSFKSCDDSSEEEGQSTRNSIVKGELSDTECQPEWEPNSCTLNSEMIAKLNTTISESFQNEVGPVLTTKRTELTAAQESQHELLKKLAAGEDRVQSLAAEAQDKSALEAETAACLRCHLMSLEELGARFATDRLERSHNERRQNEVTRIEEKLSVVAEAAKTAQASLEASGLACITFADTSSSIVGAAIDNQLEAETANAAAIEGHAAMAAAMALLQDRTRARSDEFEAAEREIDMLNVAAKTLAAESYEAEVRRCNAESEVTAAVAAVTSHKTNAVRRNRAHAVDIRRAEERLAKLEAIRDIHTRGLLTGQVRRTCQPAEDAAGVAAETAAKDLARATQLHEEAKAADEQQLQALEAIACKARKNLRKRDNVSAALATRVEDAKASLQMATGKQAVAEAACKAVNKELEGLKPRVEALVEPLEECASRLEESKKAVAAARKEVQEEQAALQRAVEADAQLLKNHQDEEATLMQALEEAQLRVVDALEDAAPPSEDDPRAKIDLLIESSAAACADRQTLAKEASDAYKTVLAAAEAAMEEAEHVQLGSLESVDTEEGAHQQALLESKIKDFEVEAQEKRKASQAAAAALAASKKELVALRAQQRATPLSTHSIEKLVCDEMAIVESELQASIDKERGIIAEAKERMTEWTQLKSAWSADLHQAGLEVSMAEQNIQATKALAWCYLAA